MKRKTIFNKNDKSEKGVISMGKYIELQQDSYSLEKGAILKLQDGYYVPISELWTSLKSITTPRITEAVVEASMDEADDEWFKRVYEVGALGKVSYLARAEAKAAVSKLHKTAHLSSDK